MAVCVNVADKNDLAVLLEAVRQGDQEAPRHLYKQTKTRVFNLAPGYAQNRQDAEEIAQDVYVELFRPAFGHEPRVALLSFSVTPWFDSVPRLRNYAAD